MKTTTTYRQKDNGWQIIVSYKDGKKWKQKSRQGFARKADAKEAEAELIKQIKNQPRPVDRAMAGITLLDFCNVYVKNKKSISENTRRQYVQAVKSLKALAKRPVHMITYLDLQTAVSEWNIAPLTQKQYRSKLNIIFRAAIKPYGLITENPVTDVEVEKVREKTERKTLSADQAEQLMKIGPLRIRIAAAICYYTGVRRGEMLALTWKDIDFSKMEISINKQFDSRRPGYHTTKPKSINGYRTIPIPQVLLSMLKHYHNVAPINLDRRLFRNPHGVYEQLTKELKRIDPGLSAHSLRHTYATNVLAKGVDIRTVAALLGDDVKTVINTYIHYSDDMRKAAAEDIKKIFAENF